jgi:hypothetical protein
VSRKSGRAAAFGCPGRQRVLGPAAQHHLGSVAGIADGAELHPPHAGELGGQIFQEPLERLIVRFLEGPERLLLGLLPFRGFQDEPDQQFSRLRPASYPPGARFGLAASGNVVRSR